MSMLGRILSTGGIVTRAAVALDIGDYDCGMSISLTAISFKFSFSYLNSGLFVLPLMTSTPSSYGIFAEVWVFVMISSSPLIVVYSSSLDEIIGDCSLLDPSDLTLSNFGGDGDLWLSVKSVT